MERRTIASLLVLVGACDGGSGRPDGGGGDDAATTVALRVVVRGPGGVRVDPPGSPCSGDCTSAHPPGQQVALTASPTSSSEFTGWSGACGGTDLTTSITVIADVTCYADFVPLHQLSVGLTGRGSATITSAPGAIACPGTCSARYREGQVVSLSAAPAPGVGVVGWRGDCAGTAVTTSVTMDADRTCTLELGWDSVHWARTYGTTRDNRAYGAVATAGGGYVTAGYSGDEDQGLHDGLVIAVDGSGAPIWQARYNTPNKDELEGVVELPGGGYIAAGRTYLAGRGLDAWVIRLDAAGDPVWQTTFGDAGDTTIHGITAVAGGFVLVGEHQAVVGSVVEQRGVVVAISDTGAVLWSRLLLAGTASTLDAVTTLSGGDALAVGWSSDGPWLVEIDPGGTVIRGRTITTATDATFTAVTAAAGGWLAAGRLTRTTSSYTDAWLVRFDDSAAITWQKTYSAAEAVYAVAPRGGGFAVAGQTQFDSIGDVASGWLLAVDDTGAVQWERQYGSPYVGAAGMFRAVATAGDGRVLAAGHDSGWGVGSADAWLASVDAVGAIGAATCPAWVATSMTSTVTTTAATSAAATIAVGALVSPVSAAGTAVRQPLSGTVSSVCFD